MLKTYTEVNMAGKPRRPVPGGKPCRPLAVEDAEKMNAVKLKLHSIFTKFATETKRFRALGVDPTAASLALQLDVYSMGSVNVNKVSNHIGLVRNFFLDLATLGFSVQTWTDWDAATWVRARVACGKKTAGKYAIACLKFIEQCTAEACFAKSPLVLAQVKPKDTFEGRESPEAANAPQWKHVKMF